MLNRLKEERRDSFAQRHKADLYRHFRPGHRRGWTGGAHQPCRARFGLHAAQFSNDSGATITSLLVSYFGEEWRLGQTGRGPDRLDFQYSTDATDLTSGIWTDVNALDFITPNTAGAAGARDGNSTADRTSISSTVGGLNISSGARFWIRWTDYSAAGNQDGLAVDDFSLTLSGTTPSADPGALPEPKSLALAALGLGAAALVRRRQQQV